MASTMITGTNVILALTLCLAINAGLSQPTAPSGDTKLVASTNNLKGPTADDHLFHHRVQRSTSGVSDAQNTRSTYYARPMQTIATSASLPSSEANDERQKLMRLLPLMSVLRLGSNPFAVSHGAQNNALDTNYDNDDVQDSSSSDDYADVSAYDNQFVASHVPRVRNSRAFVSDDLNGASMLTANGPWSMTSPSFKRNPVSMIKSARYDFGLGKRLSPSNVHAYEFGLGKRPASTATIHRYDFGLGRR